jgi:hypothetical protein
MHWNISGRDMREIKSMETFFVFLTERERSVHMEH